MNTILDDPWGQFTIGGLSIILGYTSSIFSDLYPIITTVGGVAASFLAIVGAVRIIKGWFTHKKVDLDD